MDALRLFEWLGTAREMTLSTLEGLTPSQLTTIPEGFSNHILWNAAHLAATNVRYFYQLGGLPLPIPENFMTMALRGTSPREWTEPLPVDVVVDTLKGLTPIIVSDYRAGKFDGFTPKELRPGIVLNTVEDAITLAVLHEGMHLGIIMELKKLVK